MKLPKELTTVTSLSRLTAWIVLVGLTLIGFAFGIIYQETLEFSKKSTSPAHIVSTKKTSPTNETANWKTYKSTRFKYQISYPPLWKLTEQSATGDINLASQETIQDGIPKFLIETNTVNRSRGDITVQEEVRQLTYETRECLPGGPPTGAACTAEPKTVSKKLLPDGNAYYLVVTATDKKIAVMPTLNEFIEIKFSVWPKDSEYLFDQILSTFQFTQ